MKSIIKSAVVFILFGCFLVAGIFALRDGIKAMKNGSAIESLRSTSGTIVLSE
jgi:hypothetical protein